MCFFAVLNLYFVCFNTFLFVQKRCKLILVQSSRGSYGEKKQSTLGKEKEKKVKAKKKAKLSWLWENMKGYRLIFILSILGTVVYNGMQLVVPYFIQQIVDNFLTAGPGLKLVTEHRALFFRLIFEMVGLTVLRVLIVYAVCMGCEHVSQKVLYRIRTYLFDKIEHQDMKFYATYRTGDLMTRLTGDLDAIRHMIAWVARAIVEAFSLLFAVLIYFLIMDWRLTLCLFTLAPFIFIVIVMFKKKVAPRHRELRERLSLMNTAAQENISGNRVVKAFAREEYEIEKFNRCNMEYSEANKKTAMTWLSFYPYVETLADLMPVVLLIVGGLFLINESAGFTMGKYVAFSSLIWAICNPMRMLGNIMNEFQRFDAASDKVMEIYYSEPEIVDSPDAIDRPERFEGKVEFKNVSFKYEDGKLPILEDISFVANPGETIAIMGETGCGKTSLIQLIPRFYEPTAGEVLVDGYNVKDLKMTQLRKNIGLATQDVLLYSDTIDGNIAYGDSHIKKEEVVKFARYSDADEFIAKMPEGYDTIIGERGVGLSGGQKQRISLARALAVKPAILILDDTTSAVDMETEKQIQQSLDELDFPCTKIIIAQRISTTKHADRILILQNGRITESGSHEELIAKKGYYYSMVVLQTGEEV